LDEVKVQYERLSSLKSTQSARETYILRVTQPLDHHDPSKGTFSQKAYLSHIDIDAPMVIYLSGYTAASNDFLTEPTEILKANQLFIEHRYFGESVPEGKLDWTLLNIEQSAEDIHAIRKKLGEIYKGKWLSTGISKGGQMVTYHKSFYPDDIDASVVYVAPLNRAEEDERIYAFLDKVGDPDCKKRLLANQLELLTNYDLALGIFKQMATEKKLNCDLPWEQFFELSILEYEFAFWQWNADCWALPGEREQLEAKVRHLFTVGSPEFFTTDSRTDLFPFFYQAYTEMGMYGYKINPFKGLTKFYTDDVSNKETFIPASFDIKYDPATHALIQEMLDERGKNMIYIHGALDPWSSTGFIPNGSTNSFRYDVQGGTHKSRMKDLTAIQKQAATDSLIKWMALPH